MSENAESRSLPRSPSAILLPILATIAWILCLPILVNHVKSRNLAQSLLIAWIVLENVYNLINPLLWPTNDFGGWWNGVGFCDVESKLRLAGYMGYISALVCIYRQLAAILNTDRIVLIPSPGQRRRRVALEITLCFGFPIYIMVAHYIVQSGRYYIFTITGCVPILDSSWLSMVLVLIWPGVMWLVAAVYCAIITHRLIKYRRQVSSILSAPQSRYNRSQFARLFAMATTLILFFVPVALYILVQNLTYRGVRNPYSWDRTHDWANSIFFMPSFGGENFGRWIEVVTGFVVFIFFGLGRDGLLLHRHILLKLGFGRVFPTLKLSHGPERRDAVHAPEHHFPTTIPGYTSSRARLIFQRHYHKGPQSIKQSSSSKPDSTSSATTEVEKEPNHDVTPPRTADRANSLQMPILNPQSAHGWSSTWLGKKSGPVPEPQDEDICLRFLVAEPSPARVDSAHHPVPSRVNQNVITVTRELEESKSFQVV